MKNSVKKNYLYNVSYTILNMLLPLLTAPYLARVLGVTGVGQYAYSFAIAQYFVLIAKLGLTNYGTREISKAEGNDKSIIFSNLFYMQIISTIIVSIVYLVFFLFSSSSNKTISLIFFIWVFSSFLDIDWFWFGEQEFKKIAIRNIIIKLLTVILVFITVKTSDNLIRYTLIMVLGYVFGYLSIWIGVRKRIKLHKIDWKIITKHLGPCLLMIIPVMALNIYRSMDKVMLGYMSSIDSTGIYENGEKLIYCMSSLISSLGTVMMPKISYLVQKNKNEAVHNYIIKSLKFMMIMTSILSFGLMAISDNIIPLLFGNEFKNSSTVLFLCAPTLLFIGWSNVIRTQYIIPMKKDKVYIKSITIGSIINLVLNFILIPRYSIIGAIIGTICAELFVPIYQFCILRKELNYKNLIKETIAFPIIGTIMLLVVLVFKLFIGSSIYSLVLEILLGALVYGVLSILYLSIFDKKMKKEILFSIKKRG